MDPLQRLWTPITEGHWHKWYAPFIVAALLCVALWGPVNDGRPYLSSWPWASWPLVILLATLIVWYATNRPPRVEKGKVGIALAISAETPRLQDQLRSDFTARMRDSIASSAASRDLTVVEFPSRIARLCVDPKSAGQLRQRARAHFLAYGTLVERNVQGQQTLVLNVVGMVAHEVIPERTRTRLTSEFIAVFPRRLFVPRNDELLAFEATSEDFAAGAQYVLSLAAFVSGDPTWGESLLIALEKDLSQLTHPRKSIRRIRNHVRQVLPELYVAWIESLSRAFIATRDSQLLPLTDELCDKLLARDPEHPYGNLIKAHCDFLLRGNVGVARQRLLKCKGVKDATWRYGLAFLLAYEDRMGEARAMYAQAFQAPLLDPSVPIQCEEFIQSVLLNRPDLHQLHFASGLINEVAKEDLVAAYRDYEAFLSACPVTCHPKEVSMATDALRARQE